MKNLERSSIWTAYNAAQCEEKDRFVALLADLCSTVPQPEQHGRGRPRLPLSDMLFASVYKVYVGFSSRRFTSDLHDAYTAGLIDSKPHFNSVSNYLSKPELTDILKELITASSLPLKAIEGFAPKVPVAPKLALLHLKSRSYKRGRDVQKVSGSPGRLGGAGFLRPPRLRDDAQLLHQAQHVKLRPVFSDLAILNAKHVHPHYRE
jgi:hypothetical protein